MKTHLDRVVRRVLVPAAVLSLTACPQETAVWIPRASTTANLVFHLGKERGHDRDVALGMLRVRRCGGGGGGAAAIDSGAMWALYAVDRAQEVSKIRYGETPAGFRSATGAVPLIPGCYR